MQSHQSPVTSHQVKRYRLLKVLFAQAKKRGIESDELRDVIAPGIIGKRLSQASMQEIVTMIEHITGKKTAGNKKRYEPSRVGLIEELEDEARARWGEDFSKPLNAFINSHREIPTNYQWMSVGWLKAFKERLKELNNQN